MTTAAVACALCFATKSQATQHLVDSGKDWQRITPLVRPGDEILLLPGDHRSAVLDGLQGTKDEPITIRGLDPNNPPAIDGAIALLNPRNIILENVVFDRCNDTTILIGRGASESDSESDESIGHVTIRNIRFTNIGMKPSTKVIEISGVSNITISDCNFEGWAGRAVNVEASSDVTIERCTFTGVDKYRAELAIAIQGGSHSVVVTGCRFERVGLTCAISLGGRTALRRLEEMYASQPSGAPLFEASQCRVEQSYFIDQPCPILMAHTEKCTIRNCTILRPRRWVFAMVSMHQETRVSRNTNPKIANNIVVWKPGELTGLLLADLANHGVDIVMESNLWWSNEPPDVRSKMLPSIGAEIWPQVIDVDPLLNNQHQPTNAEATLFGARAE